MNLPLIRMTRELANEILSFWRDGLADYDAKTIRMALYVTGDLETLA